MSKVTGVVQLVNALEAENTALKGERDALAAQVEAMREMANRANKHLTKGHGTQVFSALYCNLALSALAELDAFTPQQCLREIEAKAGRAGFIAGCHCGANYNVHDWDNQADEYANTVRQGGDE